MASSYRKLIWCGLFYCFRYIVQPARWEGHLFQLRRSRRIHRSVRVLPTVAAMPQVQTTRARTMLCEINYGKYLPGETRSTYASCLVVSSITLEQTDSFLCTTNFCLCCAELRCDEVTLPKAESEGNIGGRAWRARIRDSFGWYRLSYTFLHHNAETIRKAVSDSLQQHGYIWFISRIITMIVLSPISSRCIVKLYSRQKQVFHYLYLLLLNYQLHPIMMICA